MNSGALHGKEHALFTVYASIAKPLVRSGGADRPRAHRKRCDLPALWEPGRLEFSCSVQDGCDRHENSVCIQTVAVLGAAH